MKWFKHFVNASDSVKLNNLIDDLGIEGYGRYWLLLELLAEELEESGTFHIHFRKISTKLHIKFSKKLQTFLQKLVDFHLIQYELSGKVYKIECPILLELQNKDSKYNRKRVVSNDSNTTLDKIREDKKREEKKENNLLSFSDSENHPEKPRIKFEEIAQCFNNVFSKEIETGKVTASTFFITRNYMEHLKESLGFLTTIEAWRELFEKAKTLDWYLDQGWFSLLWLLKAENAVKIQQSKNTIDSKPTEQKLNLTAINTAIRAGKRKVSELPEINGFGDREKDFILNNGGLLSLGNMNDFQISTLARECK